MNNKETYRYKITPVATIEHIYFMGGPTPMHKMSKHIGAFCMAIFLFPLWNFRKQRQKRVREDFRGKLKAIFFLVVWVAVYFLCGSSVLAYNTFSADEDILIVSLEAW